MHLQIIVGSIRDGRVARPVADWACQRIAQKTEVTVELIDLKDWDLPMFSLGKSPMMGDYQDPHQQRWARKISQGDGYLFISPEYNHGYSAVLKNALDYLYGEWGRKPANFISYGGVDGARSVEQLRQVVIELQMAPLRNALHIHQVWDKIHDERFAGDDTDSKVLDVAVDDLIWWMQALSGARQQV
jgi:NAD(P)H-dependent FMN reductase